MSNVLDHLPQVITAVGGLGTAAFGLLDAAKSTFPGINRIGFSHISQVVSGLTPAEAGGGAPINALPRANILQNLEANWINGTDLASQKSIAKSLIKLHMSPGNASSLAATTNVNPLTLIAVAGNIQSATPMTQPQIDTYARFDLIVTAMLDEAYQYSDQLYRNWTRVLAGAIAVVLALTGGWTLYATAATAQVPLLAYWTSAAALQAALVGLLATPLAPIAKDLSSGLATAVNTLQAIKK